MSPEDLVQALAELPRRETPRLLVGPATLDDAGVYALDDETALVQTVDFFPPVVDDPEFYGRIAAANALSDVFAMGGEALTALSIVGWPEELPPSLLGRILAGGQEKIDEAGAVLAGGHTVTDAEIKYGLAITGRVHPARILTNAGAKPGDRLVLTKPLGMGAITTGIKKGKVSEARALAAMECMATLNRGAAQAARECGLVAATDVTGFGLCGHAAELARASGVTLEISAAKVPAFGGALELLGQGVVSGGAARTRAFLGDRLGVDEAVSAERLLLCLDAETSGGLLLPVPAADCEGLLEACRRHETPCAVEIGRVVERGERTIRILP